jgi:hypothetical protein
MSYLQTFSFAFLKSHHTIAATTALFLAAAFIASPAAAQEHREFPGRGDNGSPLRGVGGIGIDIGRALIAPQTNASGSTNTKPPSAPRPGKHLPKPPHKPGQIANPGPQSTPGPAATPGPAMTPGPTVTPGPATAPGPTANPGPATTPGPEITPGPTVTPGPRPEPPIPTGGSGEGIARPGGGNYASPPVAQPGPPPTTLGPPPTTPGPPPTTPGPYTPYTRAWTCDRCQNDCKANSSVPPCKPGSARNRQETEVRSFKGLTIVKVRVDQFLCSTTGCMTWLEAHGEVCCSYNQWHPDSYTYWGTRQTGPGGTISYVVDSSFPCSCGSIFESVEAMNSTGQMLKADAFKVAVAGRCPGLSIDDAVALLKACKAGDESTLTGIHDWGQFIDYIIGLWGNMNGESGAGWSAPDRAQVPRPEPPPPNGGGR